MNFDKIIANPAENEFNVIIEIAQDTPNRIKYEFDKTIGALVVDRIMQTAMFYPANYGFIPHTLSDDGDPIDVLVVSNQPIMPGAVIKTRPIGVLTMEDESGQDEKIIAVPTSKIDCSYDNVTDINHIDDMLKNRIWNFFENYKKLEKGKWVKITGWEGKDKAKSLINEAIKRVKI